MIKVAHEMPKFMMQNGMEKKYNDYSYALVHLFEEHEDYYKYFVNALRSGREVILDNSIFELGKSFDPEKFAAAVRKLATDAGPKAQEYLIYVIPDVLDDRAKTITNMREFKDAYPDLPGRTMAVAQGSTMNELLKCFSELKGNVDRIGISFNCKAYDKEMGKFDGRDYDDHQYEDLDDKQIQLIQWKHGRQLFLEMLYHFGLLEGTEIHLLGAALPDEFRYYTSEHPELEKYIRSLDTSNPVVHGLLGIRYDSRWGLRQKESIKLFEMIDLKPSSVELKAIQTVMYNIDTFRVLNKLPKPIPGLSRG